ncbi:predicted protein [Histoplasma capsulatum G186AR]|uniref:Uncharacterized protein n=1 Tax=Ajellomyces capsulatus (strain G186AR / H82 / ATCC MYA-2454 / RMSCC 2432) TaxID=447093 RepID=C0NT84_AJECG|nr:uncharacterized protein HCBG_06364 [Histoplasma capsulatum G186AR]EEH05245.1 predicted protein [Histoplasma capsulatum G186AR]
MGPGLLGDNISLPRLTALSPLLFRLSFDHALFVSPFPVLGLFPQSSTADLHRLTPIGHPWLQDAQKMTTQLVSDQRDAARPAPDLQAAFPFRNSARASIIHHLVMAHRPHKHNRVIPYWGLGEILPIPRKPLYSIIPTISTMSDEVLFHMRASADIQHFSTLSSVSYCKVLYLIPGLGLRHGSTSEP